MSNTGTEIDRLNKLDFAYITADTRARLNLFVDNEIAYTQLDGETYKDALRTSSEFVTS